MDDMPDWFGRALSLICALIVVFLLMGAVAAYAQEGSQSPHDEFVLDQEADHYATITFYNATPPASGGHPLTLTDGDLTVRLRLAIGMGPETLTVLAPEGWVAIPGSVTVEDGETGVIELFRGGLGM